MGNVAGDTVLQSDALEDLQSAVNYRRWLCNLGLPWLGADAIEVGPGLGTTPPTGPTLACPSPSPKPTRSGWRG